MDLMFEFLQGDVAILLAVTAVSIMVAVAEVGGAHAGNDLVAPCLRPGLDLAVVAVADLAWCLAGEVHLSGGVEHGRGGVATCKRQ